MHRVYLPFGTGIGRPPVTVKSALIANTDTCLIKAFRMSSYPFNGAGSLDVAIFPDIKVIADILESALQVALPKLLYGEGNIAARCAAMNHQQLNLTWEIAFF